MVTKIGNSKNHTCFFPHYAHFFWYWTLPFWPRKSNNYTLPRLIVFLSSYPPGKKTSWRSRNDVPLFVPAKSQVRLRWNTPWHLDGMSSRLLSATSPRSLTGTSPRSLQRTQQRRLIGTSSERLKQVSTGTPNDVSLVRHQEVLVVNIHRVPLVRPYDVSY